MQDHAYTYNASSLYYLKFIDNFPQFWRLERPGENEKENTLQKLKKHMEVVASSFMPAERLLKFKYCIVNKIVIV